MIAMLLNALFPAGGLLAVAAIFATVQRYGRTALALRGALRACPAAQEISFSLREIAVHPPATVLRPNFRSLRAEPVPQAVQLAAA